jgi:RND family efflux transporter MFP subunit
MIPMNTLWKSLSTSFLAVLVALLVGCGKPHESHESAQPTLPTAQVRAQTAQMKKQVLTEEVVGTVRAKVRATLEAKLSGRIVAMPVELGQQVKAGALVAQLDAAEIKARFEQAQASLDQTERDWKRAEELLKHQAMTRSEYDAADARRRVAKAALAEAQAMISYVKVSAPFNGVVVRKWAEVGDQAAPGKPLIEIEDTAVLQLEADVPEAIASRIQRGGALVVRVDSLSESLAGTVAEIAPAADSASRTFRVKLSLPPTRGLMSGQFARLIVPVGESSSVRVPATALVRRGQLEIVFVVTNGRAQLRLVKTGKRFGDEIEIVSGLDGGESVVNEGAAQLMDGQPVEAK